MQFVLKSFLSKQLITKSGDNNLELFNVQASAIGI